MGSVGLQPTSEPIVILSRATIPQSTPQVSDYVLSCLLIMGTGFQKRSSVVVSSTLVVYSTSPIDCI